MKIIQYFLLLNLTLQNPITLFDLDFNSPYKQSPQGQCGCYTGSVDAFPAPDYGDSSKAEESKQIASWWVAGANLMVERSLKKDPSAKFRATNFRLSQVKTNSDVKKISKQTNYIREMFSEPKYKTVNMCPLSGSIYSKNDMKISKEVSELPWALTNTYTDVEFGDYDTNHLRIYLKKLHEQSPDLIQIFLSLVTQGVQMDTYFDSFEMRTLLSFINEKCFTVKNNKGTGNLHYTYLFLKCYYDNIEDDDQIKECLTRLFKDIAKLCKMKEDTVLDLIDDMGLETATPFLRAAIFMGINYTRTIHETILPRCPLYETSTTVDQKVKAVKDCKLKATDVQSRKDVARIGYKMKNENNDDFISYGFCQIDNFPLALQISFDIVDQDQNVHLTQDFQFVMWINLKASQANARKQAIDGAGIINCDFYKEQFPFQRVLKNSELHTICNKTVQVITACFGSAYNQAKSKIKGKLAIDSPSEFCLDKPFYDHPKYFVKVFRKPPIIIPEPPVIKEEPKPEPEPPLFYSFTCKEFESWIKQMLKDQSIQDLFNSMNQAFNTSSDKDQSYIDLNIFMELWKEFQLICEEGQTSSFYKIRYPMDIQLKSMIYKYTSGYIMFRKRIVLRLSFYMLTDVNKQNPKHPKPFNPDSTQFCFEVEKSLTTSFESYFECNIYPMINPPLGSTDIPWDYDFQVYINFMKTYFIYLWKLKKIIEYQLTPFEIYSKIFNGLTIKANNISHKLIMEKNGSLINVNGVFLNFKLENFELIDFSLQIRNEGSYQIKTIIKTGYIEYHFYIYKFFEYGASFRGGKKIDMSAVEMQLKKIIEKFLKNDYMDMVKVFFMEILQIYSSQEYKSLMSDMGFQISVDYGLLKNYMFSDLMSFKVFALMCQYHILQLEFDMIDIERYKGENLQKIVRDPQEFYYFKEGHNYDAQISLFEGVTKQDIIFDKPINKQPQIIMKELELLLFKENNLNLQKPIYFMVGLPNSHTKVLITLYHIGGDLIDSVLMIIESKFYYKEFFIPFSAPFLISQKIQQILQETQKNEMDYLHNYLFNKVQTQIDLSVEVVKQLLEEANKQTNYKLPFCSVTSETTKDIQIYVGQPNLFKDLLNSKDYKENIEPCKSMDKMVKVIEIADTVYGGIPSISLTIAEPNKNAEKIKLNFAQGVFLKRHQNKRSMQTQLIFFKSRQKEEQQLLKKFLISHLKHFVEDEFDKLDEEIENKIKEFFKTGNQIQLSQFIYYVWFKNSQIFLYKQSTKFEIVYVIRAKVLINIT